MSDLVRIQMLIDKKQRDELNEIAEKEGRSFSELVRALLDAQLRERKYAEMRLAAAQLLADYAQDSELTHLTSLDGEDFINA